MPNRPSSTTDRPRSTTNATNLVIWPGITLVHSKANGMNLHMKSNININLYKYNQSLLTKVLNATNYMLNIAKTNNRNYTLFKHKSYTSVAVGGVCIPLGRYLTNLKLPRIK